MANWFVRMSATSIKEVHCQNCTREEAITRPLDFSVAEQDLEPVQFTVLSVEEEA